MASTHPRYVRLVVIYGVGLVAWNFVDPELGDAWVYGRAEDSTAVKPTASGWRMMTTKAESALSIQHI